MTSFTRIQAVLLNPVFVTLLTSGFGLGSSTLTLSGADTVTAAAVGAATVAPIERAPSTPGVRPGTAETSDWSRPAAFLAPTKAEAELARRVSDALSGRNVHKPATPTTLKPKAAEPTPRVWVCGAWEELIQGRGHGRTCEWR